MSSDFDHLNGWVSNMSSLTSDKAHSGAYSLVVKPGISRSLGYDNTLGQLSSARPGKIRLSAWVMRTGDQHAAKLIVEIKDPATSAQVFGDSLDLGEAVQKRNTWQRVERVIVVPPMVSATAHIMVYMRGAGADQPTYLDDLTLSLVTR